jgi:hypothetical protein
MASVNKKNVLILTLSSAIILVFAAIMVNPFPAGCSRLIGNRTTFDTIPFLNPTYQVPIPNEISFAGEPVPLHLFDVRESLDRELQVNTYWHSQTVLLLKRANRYFPIIEPILKEKGIPDDFKYLAVAESALTQAVSPSQAVGFWQILEGTGKELGLEINDEVDERYHIEKSTYAACNYLLKSHKQYESWTMTAASYNFGRNGINRQIERQNNNDYYDMVLGEETGRYVFRCLALKVIFENPEQYGFFFHPKDLYPPLKYYTVEVDSSVTSFAAFAQNYNTSYKMLKLLNPWLRKSYLTNKSKKRYTIKIPEEGFRESAYQ